MGEFVNKEKAPFQALFVAGIGLGNQLAVRSSGYLLQLLLIKFGYYQVVMLSDKNP